MVAPRRIVSLLPAATEMVCFLGKADLLVGRSHECDFPAEISHLPECTGSNVDSHDSSTAIDQQVKTLTAEGHALYRLNVESIRELKPDLIITQAQCDVCAISLSEVEKLVEDWPGSRKPVIVTLSAKRLAGIWDDIRNVSEALQLGDEGRTLLRALKARVVAIIEKACMIQERPKVFCLEWIEPLMAAGNWVPEMVDLCGGKSVAGIIGGHSDWIDWEKLTALDPEIIVAMPCGFNLDRTVRELQEISDKPEWKRLRAVRKRQVYCVDANSYFNRPGPRIVDSMEMLAEIFHPKIFPFGGRDKTWRQL